LLEHKNNLSKVSKERQVAKDQAELLAKSTEGPRVQRADITRITAHLKELRQDAERLRKSNDNARTRIAALRTQLATRRSNLLTARSISTLSSNDKSTRSTVQFPESTSTWDASLDDVTYQLTQTRKSLVEELLEAFDLAETDVSLGRSRQQNVQGPTVGVSAWNASAFGRQASKLGSELFLRPPLMAPKRLVAQPVMKWTISGLSVPLPAELNRLVENGITAS
ncbi:6090_t:CDS:2, partial [Acaulospora colombiana]